MKMIFALLAGIAAACTAASAPQWGSGIAKPWEITLGASFWTDDHEAIGFDTGFIAGLDYYTGNYGDTTTGFFGARAMFGSGGGMDSRTLGMHLGTKMALAQPGSPSPIYLKAAGGYYNTELTNGTSSDSWGFGGFVGLGYDFASARGGGLGGISAEGGYFFAPSTAGVDNRGWYFALGIRF